MLVAQSRVDAKTGLLNVSTWEIGSRDRALPRDPHRAARWRSPSSTSTTSSWSTTPTGTWSGDRVLKAIAEALTGQSRDYDRVGRFGGEEFVLLLAQTTENDACKIAERLRGYVASLTVPVDDRPDAPTLSVTISIGVTAMARGESRELTDLLAAADSAMYHAKQAGRNRVAFAPPLRDMGMDATWNAAGRRSARPLPRSAPATPPGGRHPAVRPPGGAGPDGPDRRFFMPSKVTLRAH